MFNQAAFNSVAFNREFSVNVFGSFILEGNGEMIVSANVHVSPSFDFEAIAEMAMSAIRERFGAFLFEGIGELETSFVRQRFFSFDFQGVGELSFEAGRNRVDIIEFDGEFRPGDRIVIDSKLLTMTINGTNALPMMTGDFFDLNLGTNEIVYTDDQGSRSVLIRVTYRDKYV